MALNEDPWEECPLILSYSTQLSGRGEGKNGGGREKARKRRGVSDNRYFKGEPYFVGKRELTHTLHFKVKINTK